MSETNTTHNTKLKSSLGTRRAGSLLRIQEDGRTRRHDRRSIQPQTREDIKKMLVGATAVVGLLAAPKAIDKIGDGFDKSHDKQVHRIEDDLNGPGGAREEFDQWRDDSAETVITVAPKAPEN